MATAQQIARNNRKRGQDGQREVVQMILSFFPQLTEDDVRSVSRGASGEDILVSALARRLLRGSQIEVKRRKSHSVCRFMEQAQGHGGYNPLLFIREDGKGKEWY